MSNVINFIPHFEQKKNRQRIEEELNASGWEITDEINCLDSDFCVYLMDTKEQCVILFGAKLESLPLTGGASIDWHHFVLAWDVIADPEMTFDETHKRHTIDMSLSALSGITEWDHCCERICKVESNKTPHLLVLIDRKNIEMPAELIVAYSESKVLNTDSLHAIVNSYIGT